MQVRVRRRGIAAAAAAEAEAELAMLPEQAEQERARQLALQKALQLVMRLEDALGLFSSNVVWHHNMTFCWGRSNQQNLTAGAIALLSVWEICSEVKLELQGAPQHSWG